MAGEGETAQLNLTQAHVLLQQIPLLAHSSPKELTVWLGISFPRACLACRLGWRAVLFFFYDDRELGPAFLQFYIFKALFSNTKLGRES